MTADDTGAEIRTTLPDLPVPQGMLTFTVHLYVWTGDDGRDRLGLYGDTLPRQRWRKAAIIAHIIDALERHLAED